MALKTVKETAKSTSVQEQMTPSLLDLQLPFLFLSLIPGPSTTVFAYKLKAFMPFSKVEIVH
jgi:hypothetical protein